MFFNSLVASKVFVFTIVATRFLQRGGNKLCSLFSSIRCCSELCIISDRVETKIHWSFVRSSSPLPFDTWKKLLKDSDTSDNVLMNRLKTDVLMTRFAWVFRFRAESLFLHIYLVFVSVQHSTKVKKRNLFRLYLQTRFVKASVWNVTDSTFPWSVVIQYTPHLLFAKHHIRRDQVSYRCFMLFLIS